MLFTTSVSLTATPHHRRTSRFGRVFPRTGGPLFHIFLVSLVALYFELVVIRWLSSEIQVFAWLKNLPLLAAFLGLGIGSLTPSAQHTLSWRFAWLVALLALVLVASGPLQLDRISFPDPSITTWHAPSPTETSWYEVIGGSAVVGAFALVVLGLSALVAALFTLVGQALGAAMNTTRPLAAYSANIGGSLAGVLVFTLLSFLQTAPAAWLAVGLITALPLLPRRWAVGLPILGALALVVAYSQQSDVLWSPYYRVSYSPIPGHEPPVGYTIMVNRHYHQQAVGLADDAIRRNPNLTELRAEYDLPFVVAPRRDAVALLGAGAGNDAAAALRQGARRIVAVEIDPAIIQLGHRLHDDRPYSSAAVEVINADARAWLRQSDERFDVISFGLVDSHTVLSSMSSIRLESYLYTVESLRDVTRLLKPDGLAAMSFVIGSHEWQGQRLFNTIVRAAGAPPIVVDLPGYGVSYLFGPGAQDDAVHAAAARWGFPVATERFRGSLVRPATDDWPFLYLNPGQHPVAYLLVLAGLLLFSFLGIRSSMAGDTRPSALNVQMFFMGAGFLLIETKSIAELSLLFGSTWVVNAAVFSAILAMVLIANAIVGRWRKPRLDVLYALLLLSLVLGFLFPVSALNSLGVLERAVLGSTVSALPIAFSGVIFATAFRLAERASTALGWNLFGAIVGGVLEASSMWLGIKALSLLAAALYGCSAVAFAAIARPGANGRPARPAG